MASDPPTGTTPSSGQSRNDAELIAATRNGDTTAYGQLYERHVHAAQRLARILTHDHATADDLVSETFAKMLATLSTGRGPDLAFRAYLLTTLRHTFYDRTRRDKKVEFTDDMTRHDIGEDFEDPAVATQERRYAARAFHRLPERWQVVLWHTEVEGETAAQVAPLLGLSANGVSALAYRARERLRQMYLQEHVADSHATACRWTADRLGARVRGGLSPRDVIKIDNHLEECAGCKLLMAELTEVNSGMRGVLAPVLLGLAAPAYLGGSTFKGAVIVGWYTSALSVVTHAAQQTLNWVRRFIQQLGVKGATAIGGVTAIIAGILIMSLVANDTPAPPPPQAQPPGNEAAPPGSDTPDSDPGDKPKHPPSDDNPGPTPQGNDDKPANNKPADKPEHTIDNYDIATELSSGGLAAGQAGAIEVQVDAPQSDAKPAANAEPAANRFAVNVAESGSVTDQLTMTVDLPPGVTAVAGEAGDGWNCDSQDGSRATCQHDELKPGTSTTANVPVDIDAETAGFQDVPVSLTGGGISDSQNLRVPVAPLGTQVGYASQQATGTATAGNTLLTCKPAKVCQHDRADNELSLMSSYAADSAPAGVDSDSAVSGAHLDIPQGAEVLWAGLHWTGSHNEIPQDVQLAAPGGAWSTASQQKQWTGAQRPVTQSAIDVTDMVAGSGDYWVSADSDSLPTGPHEYAGWSMTAVYSQPGAEAKETAVYEGLAQTDRGQQLSLSLPGGDVDASYTLWDGDRNLTGDSFDIGGSPVGEPNNVGHGCSISATEGEDWNTLGVDVASYHVAMGPQPGYATFSAGNDPIDIGVLALSTPKP